jgi:REP element-mobilizing transposase RayT
MATKNKIYIPNEIYFITFTILDWRSIFVEEKYINLVYKWFDYMKTNYGNKIHGYVIMPNHLHLLVYLTDRSPQPSKLIQNAKRFLAYQIVALLQVDNKTDLLDLFKSEARTKFGAKHKVFEDNFDSLVIQSRKLFLEKLNYIHNNPCQEKWALVDSPENYIHSSAANYFIGKGLYDVDVLCF